MDFYMLRSFDHAGYYETRLILLAASIAVAAYFAHYKRDRRFAVMLMSGVVFQAVLEYSLQLRGLRGANYSLSVFGWKLPPLLGPLFQGLAEGGIFSLFAFWYTDLRVSQAKKFKQWAPWLALCALIVTLAFVVGVAAAGQPISSPRPMFAPSSVYIITTIIFVSLLLVWRKDAVMTLAKFYAGLLIYAVLTFEPLHALGARYIGERNAGGQFVTAPLLWQIGVMLSSHVFEVAGGKLHYFAVPFALGLINFKKPSTRSGERLSTQYLENLAQRGWRWASKPFQEDDK